MGRLKFRFSDGETVVCYETDGTEKGSLFYYCPVEDYITWGNFIKNNPFFSVWLGDDRMVCTGLAAIDIFEHFVEGDRIRRKKDEKRRPIRQSEGNGMWS